MNKILWVEGLLLNQQHFQQWDKFNSAENYFYQQALSTFGYGVISQSLHPHSLLNGEFRLIHCRAILPDFTIINFDSQNGEELSCNLNDSSQSLISIYIAVPKTVGAHEISGYPNPVQKQRWRAQYKNVSDQFDADRQSEVLTGRLNLSLLLEADENHEVLKLAEIIRRGKQDFQLNPQFIPTCLHIKSSPELGQLLQQLIISLTSKLNDYSYSIQNSEYSQKSRDLQSFFITKALYTYLPKLKNIYYNPQLHPFELYKILLDLLTEFQFAKTTATNHIPCYEHKNLTEVFFQLENLIFESLQNPTEISQPYQLIRESETFYKIDNLTPELLQNHFLYLAVKFSSTQLNWPELFVRQTKISSLQHIENIYISAVSGVNLTHCIRNLEHLTLKPGREYFLLEARCDYWQQIIMDRNLAILISPEFVNAQIELVIAREI